MEASQAPTTAIVSATPARLFEGTIYDITVDPGEPGGGDETTISATGEHPFLVARAGPHAAALDTRADPEAVALVEPLDTRDRTGQDRTGHGRWVPASDLAEGDAVRTMSPQGVAGTATVTKIRGRHAVVPVYNLTVEGTSRYLVGACGVVVHNKGEGAGGGGAASALNAARLRSQLAAREIADGHAFDKHVLHRGEFVGLGIRTRQQFADLIEGIMSRPTAMRWLQNGRTAFWDDATGTVVIRDPRRWDGGTCFRPAAGRKYFQEDLR